MYPHRLNSSYGVFVEEQTVALSKRCEVKVVCPCPWFLPVKIFRKWYRYTLRAHHEIRKGIDVFRPRYIVLPRDFFSIAGIGYFFSVLTTVKRLSKVFRYDVVHAHGVYPDGFAAVLIGRVLRKPVVVTVHASNLDKLARASLGRIVFVRFALRNATLVISVSKKLRLRVVRYGAAESEVRVIPNGVDLGKFKPPLATSKHALANILFVGHLVKRKGVPYLFNALRALSDQGCDSWELNIIGDGRERTTLVRQVKDLKLAEKVHFLGALSSRKVAEEMRRCDLLVLPSFDESFGVVVIEAMACGKPVVASRSGGPEEIVTQDTGVLVGVKDQVSLANGLREVLANQERYDSKKISAYARSRFSFDTVVPQILRVYDEVCQAGCR